MIRIAVPYDNGEIFQHFGKTGAFKFYDVENRAVIGLGVVHTNGQGHGALAGFLESYGTGLVICGGIGPGAVNALKESGIKVYPGISGNADDAVEKLLEGTLPVYSGASCDHHDHDHDRECGHHDGWGDGCCH